MEKAKNLWRLEDLRASVLNDDGERARAMLANRPSPAERGDAEELNNLLIEAARHGNLSALLALLPHSDPRGVDRHGSSALMAAARNNKIECVSALLPVSDLRVKGDGGRSVIWHAIQTGATEAVEELLTAIDPKETDAQRETPLMAASHYGWPKIVKILLPFSRPRAPNEEGMTALMFAARGGHEQCVAILLPHSNVAEKDYRRGMTALDWTKLGSSPEKWACADLLAASMSAQAAADLLQEAPAKVNLPQCRARVEREALSQAVQAAEGQAQKSTSKGPGASGESALARRVARRV